MIYNQSDVYHMYNYVLQYLYTCYTPVCIFKDLWIPLYTLYKHTFCMVCEDWTAHHW